MCVHREHRTGNCRICWPPVVMNAKTAGESTTRFRVHTDDMPLLWRDQGDDN